MVKPVPSFLVSALTRSDLARINTELYDLQRQTASGQIAADLKGYGQEGGRIVSARTAIAQAEARAAAAQRLAARLDIQDTALGQAASAAEQLKQDIFTALASDDGTLLQNQLRLAFSQVTGALNTTYGGVPLFGGERRDAAPVQVTDLGDLAGAISTGTLFAESQRRETADVGVGAPFDVAEKASEVASGLYQVFRDMHTTLSAMPATRPLPADQRAELMAIVERLDAARQGVVNAQGRNGTAQASLDRAVTRLNDRADLLAKHLGDVADADLAEVAMRLSAAQTQYQAAAKVFAQIRDLSLVNFLN